MSQPPSPSPDGSFPPPPWAPLRTVGDLQACDDRYNTSPPPSRHEEYAAACAGRVEAYTLMSCTELE